jgi:F-type H+-transporting ATPase subunit b
MPQLDFADFAPQIVWLIITFALLYAVLARLVLPRIAEVLEERQDRIADDLEQAESLRKEAQAALEAYEAALNEARSDAHITAQVAHAKLAEEAAAQNEELEAKINAQASEAEARINEMRVQARDEIRKLARTAARQVTARLIGLDPGDAATDAAIDRRLKEGV